MTIELKKLIFSLSKLEREVLPYIDETSIEEISKKSNLKLSESTTAIQLLEQRKIVEILKNEQEVISLDKFGEEFLENGLPEIQLLNKLNGEAKKLSQLNLDQSIISSAMGELKKKQLIQIKKEDELIITPNKEATEFIKNSENPLKYFKKNRNKNSLNINEQAAYDELKKRKGFLKLENKKTFENKITTLGKEIQKEFIDNYKGIELEETLTTDMLKNKTYKDKKFRHYDINVQTSIPQIGRRHPMLEANKILSDIFLSMGFSEMKGPMIESAFWNMDVMWIPQDHPARDEQDTFYLEEECELDDELFEKVKEMHEKGLKETHTQKGEFSKDISKKQLLRTHSTSTTFRYLKTLSEKQKKGEDINGKYFYLANVFRNEAIDATHLAEFYQGEGFIIGDNLSLGDLMGFVKEYLARLGFNQVTFKPTFNPYTEPSMEAHVYDEEIGKSYALINSGIFRPETLKPLGLENKTIIAWGFGASRIAAKLSKKISMRDITGTTCDLEWLKTRQQMKSKVDNEKKGGN